jgi:hypothetical protein
MEVMRKVAAKFSKVDEIQAALASACLSLYFRYFLLLFWL